MQESYDRLTEKSLLFLTTVLDKYDPDYILKVDDDVFVRPDRVPIASLQWDALEAGKGGGQARGGPGSAWCVPGLGLCGFLTGRRLPTTLLTSADYIGCMKRGHVRSSPRLRWYEPEHALLGDEYFTHALGTAYAVRGSVARRLVSLPAGAGLRHLANEDVSVGLWMMALNASFFDDRRLCSPACGETGVVIYDADLGPGLRDPGLALLELAGEPDCRSPPPRSITDLPLVRPRTFLKSPSDLADERRVLRASKRRLGSEADDGIEETHAGGAHDLHRQAPAARQRVPQEQGPAEHGSRRAEHPHSHHGIENRAAEGWSVE